LILEVFRILKLGLEGSKFASLIAPFLHLSGRKGT
jgi:hypothetical protein